MQENDRNESGAEKLDRNWLELMQELRVAQTGVQILAGFLLTLPFSARFLHINHRHQAVYLVAFSLAIITVGLMTAPVALHRFLFGRQRKDVLVRVGDTFAKTGIATMGLSLITVVVLIFGVVVNDVVGLVAGALALVFYGLTWVALPLWLRHDHGSVSS